MRINLNLPLVLLIIFLLASGIVISFHNRPAAPQQAATLNLPAVEEFRTLNYQNQLDLVKQSAEADPLQTWAYVKSAFLVNGQQVGNSHQFAHLVGNGMFVKYGLEGITNCDETFAFGCFHGASQKLLEQKGVAVVKEIQNRCTQIFPPDKTQNYTGCIHGMGHGLLTWERFRLGEALLDCDILDQLYQSYCYDGVFMEHATELARNEFDPNHPWQFCSQLDSKYHYNCARYQSQIFLSQFGSDIPKIGANCALGPSEILISTCFESLGFYITQSNTGKSSEILKLCNQLSGTGVYNCIIGSSREVAFQVYVGWQETEKALCASLPEDWRTKCGPNPAFIRPN